EIIDVSGVDFASRPNVSVGVARFGVNQPSSLARIIKLRSSDSDQRGWTSVNDRRAPSGSVRSSAAMVAHSGAIAARRASWVVIRPPQTSITRVSELVVYELPALD